MEVQRQYPEVDGVSGKSLHSAVQYQGDQSFNPKDILDVITDDWTVYRFSRLMPSDPWVFENRTAPDGDSTQRKAQLPNVVEAVLEVETNEDFIY